MRRIRLLGAAFLAAWVGLWTLLPRPSHGQEAEAARLPVASASGDLTLADCLAEALRNSRSLSVSRLSVEIAEAQHRQALSGYWPQVGLKAGYEHLSTAPDFRFPASQVNVPAGTAVVTVPGGVLGPNPVQLPVATPAQTIPVPAQDVKLANPDNFLVSAEVSWLLFDGGMRRGFAEQAEGLVAAMKQDARRTDLEVSDSVVRLYYGAVLARELVRTARVTEQKLAATLDLTAAMYQGGSGKVTKIDWLDIRIVVDSVRSMLAELEKNESLAEAALAMTLGRPWSSSVRPAEAAIPFAPYSAKLDDLVEEALRLNPDWIKVQAAIRASGGALTTARSGHYPKLAVKGEAHQWWNTYDAGLATDNNKTAWSVGVGVELPLFTGFATRSKIEEAELRLAKLKEEQLLLKDGMGLRIREAYLGLTAGEKAVASTQSARDAAVEDSDLTTRAYEHGLVDTDKVIKAQLAEALMTAQHLKARYDYMVARSRIGLLVGKAPEVGLGTGP
jgi:outer membrane protein